MKLNDIRKAVVVWGVISQEGIRTLKSTGSCVIVPEQRPHLVGLMHTIPLLKKEGIDFIYCNDNTLGLLFYKGKIERTYLFCKVLSDNGIWGTNGSLYLSLLSKLHGIAVEVFLGADWNPEGSDKDVSTLGGKDFVLEKNKENHIIGGYPEFIEWEVLK